MADQPEVVIVGVGALGSHLVPLLRNLPIKLSVIDFDRVEAKNLRSQFHTNVAKGNKASSIANVMRHLWNRQVVAFPVKLTADNVEMLLGGAALVVDCLDNGEGRRLVQRYVRGRLPIDCVHGALAANGEYARIVWDFSFAIDDEPHAGAATCDGGEHLPMIALVAAYLARSVQIYFESYQAFRDGSGSTRQLRGWEITPRGVLAT